MKMHEMHAKNENQLIGDTNRIQSETRPCRRVSFRLMAGASDYLEGKWFGK